MNVKFYELAVGARFVFRGKRFEKIGMSMAEDNRRSGHVFQGDTDVEPDGAPLLLPPAEVARWKPDERYWTEYLGPAPGQREPSPEAPGAGRRDAYPTTAVPSSPSTEHTQPGAFPGPG